MCPNTWPGSLLGLDGEHVTCLLLFRTCLGPKVGMITFGISAPIKPLRQHFKRSTSLALRERKVQTEKGFTVDAVTAAARRSRHLFRAKM